MKTKLLSASVGLVCFAICIAPQVEAQTITAPNIGPVGAVVQQVLDMNPSPSVVPGPDGLNAVWDLTDLNGAVDQVLKLVDPSSVPASVSFPDANLVIELNAGEGHVFLSLDPQKLQIVGQIGDVADLSMLEGLGMADFNNVDIQVPLTFPDPVELLELPLQYGDVFQSHAETVIEMVDVLTQDLLTVQRTVTANVSVDAEGTIVLPGAIIREAIRLTKAIVTTDSVFIDVLGLQVLLAVDVNPTYVYTWLTDSPELAGLPIAEMVYDPFSELVERATYYRSSSVGIAESIGMELELYPNPSSEIANVVFDDVVSGSLSLYDSKGAIVNTIMVEGNSAQVNVSNLPVGLYQVHFAGSNNSLRTNLNVVR